MGVVELRMKGSLAEIMSELRCCLDEHDLAPTDFHFSPKPPITVVLVEFASEEDARRFERVCADGAQQSELRCE